MPDSGQITVSENIIDPDPGHHPSHLNTGSPQHVIGNIQYFLVVFMVFYNLQEVKYNYRYNSWTGSWWNVLDQFLCHNVSFVSNPIALLSSFCSGHCYFLLIKAIVSIDCIHGSAQDDLSGGQDLSKICQIEVFGTFCSVSGA